MSRTYFFWDPLSDNILQERDESGTVTAEYTTEPGLYGNLISQNRSGVESQYHFDPQGSALALTDDSQQITDTYSYTAFGEVTEQTGSTVNPFQYIGQRQYYRDAVADEYEIRRRLLNADNGRWFSYDPLVSTQVDPIELPPFASYAYVGNKPVNWFDPSGLEACHILIFGGHGATINPDHSIGEIGGWIEIMLKGFETEGKLNCAVVGVGTVCCFSQQICKKHDLPVLPGIPLHDQLAIITPAEMLGAIKAADAAAKGFCDTKVCDGEVCDTITVHVKCDKDMKKLLGKDNTKKYCGKRSVFNCKKQKWDP